jgi:hypothetical protein
MLDWFVFWAIMLNTKGPTCEHYFLPLCQVLVPMQPIRRSSSSDKDDLVMLSCLGEKLRKIERDHRIRRYNI